MADRVTWTSADGATVLDFTDEAAGFTVLGDGTAGLRSPTYSLATLKFAGVDGEAVQAIRAEAAKPTLGLLVQADGAAAFRAKARALVRAMRPKAGPGTLTVTGPDGQPRRLPCYCVAGFEGDEATTTILPGQWWKLALKLFAPTPWWLGAQQAIDTGAFAGAAFFPIFPFRLQSSQLSGSFTVDLSECDAPVYPLWTVTGPGSSLTLTNVTTGRSIVVNAPLGAGDTLVIDTRPGMQSVRKFPPPPTRLVEGRRNLVLNPSPSPTYGGTNWSGYIPAGGGTSQSTQPNGGPTGGGFLRTTTTTAAPAGATGGPFVVCPSGTATTGATYTASVWVRSSVVGNVTSAIEWHAADGSQAAPAISGPNIALPVGAWTQVSVTGTAPAGADHITLTLYGAGAVSAAGATFDATMALVEQASAVGDYFDGDTTGTAGAVYAWTGTAGASASTQSTKVALPQTDPGTNLMGALATDPALWPLIEEVNTVSVVLADSAPGSRIVGLYEPRFSGI